jgi:hypothetical protein
LGGRDVSTATLTRADVEFDRVYPWAVKSRRQSELLYAWLQLRGRRDTLPSLADFDADIRRYPDQNELTVYDVVREAALARYLVVKESFVFKRSFGQFATGRFLDDVLPPMSWRKTRPNYDTCVQLRLPVYVAFSLVERNDEHLVYERLLLPFGSAGPVTGLLTSLKTTSWKDVSARASALSAREANYSFRAVIGLD